MDQRTAKVVETALQLPEFERSVLLNRLFSAIEGGNEQEVFAAALALPEDDKWEVVAKLQDSLAHLDESSDVVWREAARSRWLQFQRGEVGALTWEEAQHRTKRVSNG